ncbi:hypothetical protein P7H60_13640 [Vagococcus carniphilus]|uniref:hypothetical protein n=1 Tax=Vagococcus carniphilus TaxID=218144 RepID=UPI00288F018C|nr:hypothetical protein [Vagococcus carniphilus]MDT2850192.1 hypothetical protein [Vagococcus carniphilus]
MVTADNLIKMKKQNHDVFGDLYTATILDIENFLVSKSDAERRINLRYGKMLDEKAKLMIVHQFFKVEHEYANDLYSIFGFDNLTEEQTFLEDKYANELLDNF